MKALLSLLVVMLAILATTCTVHGASIATAQSRARAVMAQGSSCSNIPPYMFTCGYDKICETDDECGKFGPGQKCCFSSTCPFKTCVFDITGYRQSRSKVSLQQSSTGSRNPQCPIVTLQCEGPRYCNNDYDCQISSSRDLPPQYSEQPLTRVVAKKCCYSSRCHQKMCTQVLVENVPPYFPLEYVGDLTMCPPVSSVPCYTPLCEQDEHCAGIEGAICCDSDCGVGMCITQTSPPVVPPPPTYVRKQSTNPNRTAIKMARLQAALARQQKGLQCRIVCSGTNGNMPQCTSPSDCSPGLLCCPNFCGSGRLCSPPSRVSWAALMAGEKETGQTGNGEHNKETGQTGRVKKPTTTEPATSATPTIPSFEEALIKILAKKLEN